MNIQITATRSEAGQDVTHYQLLDLDSFSFATLAKPQVVNMVESGTKISVANGDGVLIPCLVNTKNLSSGITEKWLQGQEDGEWTDDVSTLPHVEDINGANRVRRFTTKRTQND